MQRPWLSALLALACAGLVSAQNAPVEKAWELIANGRRGEAVTLLRTTLRSDPRNAEAHLLLGSVLVETGERAESIDHLRDAVRLLPNSAEAHNALGEAYNKFGQLKLARPEFEKATSLDPRLAVAHVSLAAILVQESEFQAAAGHLDQAITLIGKTPDAAYPLYLRAKVRVEEQDMAKAAADLQQAVEVQPNFPEAWSDLGEARRSLFDDAGALKAFRRAVELNPEDAVAQTRLGSKLLDAGQPHEAIPHLQEAARLDPKDQSALNALMIALRKDGQSEQANAVRQKLAQVLRDKVRADQNLLSSIELNNRGAALEKGGDLRGALEKYRAAFELNPEHVGIRTNLAIALLKLGHWDEGIRQLREASRRDPANTDLQKALDDALAQARAHHIVLSQP